MCVRAHMSITKQHACAVVYMLVWRCFTFQKGLMIIQWYALLKLSPCVGPIQIVAAWNGMAISVFALASRVLQAESSPAHRAFPVEGRDPAYYIDVALKVRLSLHYLNGHSQPNVHELKIL